MSSSRAIGTTEHHKEQGNLIMLSRRHFLNQSAGIFALGSTASALWREASRAAEPRRDAAPLAGRRSRADPGRTENDSAPGVNERTIPSWDKIPILSHVIQQNGLSARRIEPASMRRSLGSRARHRSMTAASGSGTSGRRVRTGTGCSSRSMRIRSPPPAGSS